ncbi:RHS repeat protein [Pseudomonas frederiksbergensis]|nr:RHS repeat protein [Pseudomonas frederiksbergensis]
MSTLKLFQSGFALIAIIMSLSVLKIHPAQAQSYFYMGPPFDVAECERRYGVGNCVSGSMTGSVSFYGVPPGFTGTINVTDAQSLTLSASNVGSLGLSDVWGGGAYFFVNGVITGGGTNLNNHAPDVLQLTNSDTTGGYDLALHWHPSTGDYHPVGFAWNNNQGIWFGGKSLGASCNAYPGAVSCGEPINIGTGNMYDVVTDYETVGQNKLSFIRYYNSFVSPDTYATSLGHNWRTNYDRYLHFSSNSLIEAERASGQVITFLSAAGVWSTDSDINLKLSSSGSNWNLTDSNDTVETYTSSGGKGLLSTIRSRNGYTQTLSYTSGALSSVSDSYGRTLQLNYSSAGVISSVATPDTLVLSYGYTMFSSSNMLTSVSYNTSPVTSQQYLYENTTLPYALTGIVDENGNRYASWTYDNTGRAASSQFASGNGLTQVSYDDVTGNRTVIGPLGIQETYKFTILQGVPKVTEIDRASNGTVAAATRTLSYDSAGYLASQTDWNGNLTNYTNNANGDPTTIVEAVGSPVARTTTISYASAFPNLPYTITEPDRITTLNYDSAGNVLNRVVKDQASQSVPYYTSGTTRTWQYTWNWTGQLLSYQLPRTDVTAKTTLGYTSGTLTSITDALSHVTTVLTYKSGGLPLTVTDPNSILTTYAYSPRNWLTSSVLTLSSSAGTLTTTLAYDSAGNLTKYTLPDASYLSYGYDTAQRLTSITNILGESQVLTLNSAGGVTQALWKNASAVTTRQRTATYDALGRLLTDVGGMSQTTTFGYDNNGNVLTVTDPLSQISTLQYDSLNRVKSFKDPATNLTAYTYNSHDAVLSVTDPRSKVTSYVYDGFGELIQETSPDRGTIVLKFDSDGNVSQQTDANGYVTNMTYDALDRILTRTYPADATLRAAFTYDQGGHGQGILQLTSASDQVGNLSLNYEERGLVTANNRTMTGGNTYNTAFSYDSAGRNKTITYASSGWMVTYVRDSAGQVTSVTDKPPASGAVNIVTSVTHMPFGPVKSLTWANGVTDARTYDLDYRTTDIKDVGTGNVYYSSFGYNANDNITSILDNVAAANNQTLKYNSAGWLNYASGSYGTNIALTYDSSGNRTAFGATAYTISSTSNRMTVANGSALTYTSSGNITAIGASPTFTYNKANQMATAVVSGTTSTYGYDAFGQRLSAKVGTTPVRVLTYANSNILTETSSGTKYDYVYLEDGFPIAVVAPATSTVSYIHTNYLGTPQKATNASKTTVWTGNYDPNGLVTPTTSINMNLRFPGQIADVSGFNHNGFRDYNPNKTTGGGRYLEADPIGLLGGINPYTYANNDPFSWIDPFGLETQYSLGFGGSIGLGLIGGGGGVSVGISVPDNLRNLSGYQLTLGGQVTGMMGLGFWAGYGYSLGTSHSSGPLDPFFGGGVDTYFEGDLGFGPSIGFSLQGPLTIKPYSDQCTVNLPNGPSFSMGSPVGRPGEGFGGWLGGGLAPYFNFTSPSGNQIKGMISQRKKNGR